MLSTEKAYTTSELAAFFKRVLDVAASLGIDKVAAAQACKTRTVGEQTYLQMIE